MNKQIETGKDYGFVFGLEADKGQHMIALGGDRWKAINAGREMTKESEGTTKKVMEYINRPYVMMGTPK